MIELKPLAEAEEAETALVAPSMTERVRFTRFLVTGGIAAGANIVCRQLLDFVVCYEIAVGLAYLVGMTVAFLLARNFVFQSEGADANGQYVRFTLVNIVAFVQVWFISVALARVIFPAVGLTWQAETIAHIVGVMSPIATSYVAHKRYSFRKAS